MIEVIYKGEQKKDKASKEQAVLPKNIRQIGEGGKKDRKIYIEDYAVTYMNQLAEEREKDNDKASAILLGEVQSTGNCRYIFINGALSIETLDFSEEMWDKVHQQIIEHFDGLEIVGWYLGEEESSLIVTDDILRIHTQQFPGEDKVLILRDFTEGESAVFAMEAGKLEKQKGYYIYYEKNNLMQEYMVAQNNGRTVEEQTESKDEAIQNFRKITEEKKETVKQPLATKLLYAASTFLVLTVLIIGVTLINNYDKMKNMEVALNGLTDTLAKKGGTASSGNSADAVSAMAPAADEDKAKMEINESETNVSKAESSESQTEAQTDAQAAKTSNEDVQALTEAEGQANQETDQADLNQVKITEADPSAQQSAPDESAKGPAKETVGRASYVVKDGDTIAIISEMYYGNFDKVDEICSLNGITDENRILPGQKIVLP